MPDFTLEDLAPVEELSAEAFKQYLAAFRNDENVLFVANRPDVFTTHIAEKAKEALKVAASPDYGFYDNDGYRGYRLGDDFVGFMHFRRNAHKPNEIKIVLLIGHPGVENAGDILLEHALNEAGPNPTLTLVAASPRAAERYLRLGFSCDDPRFMTYSLSPTKGRAANHWTYAAGVWKRAGGRNRYLWG